MRCIVYKCSVFVCMNKLACVFSRPSYSLVVLVINFCIVETFNFTLYTKRTYMCDTYGLITANSTCPFGTSWSQLYICPLSITWALMAVTARAGWMDGWMDAANCSSRPCSPDVYTVRVHARVRAIRMYRSIDVWRHLLPQLSQSCLQRVTVTDQWRTWRARRKPSSLRRRWSGSLRGTSSHTRKATTPLCPWPVRCARGRPLRQSSSTRRPGD